MAKNVMRKNLQQTIRRSITRYIAIVAIIALGAAMFVGLRSTKSDMVATGQVYMDEQNMFDLRLLNSYGWAQEQLDAIAQMQDVVSAEGTVSLDAIVTLGDVETEYVYKLYSIPQQVNNVYLLGGRMPQKPDECLADGFHRDDSILGTKITVAAANEEDVFDSLTNYTFTVVGYVSSPLYMDMSRGNTTLGNGSVASYIYLPKEAFSVDYYTEINITLPGSHKIYTENYSDAMDQASEQLKTLLQPLAEQRYENVRKEALDAYQEGLVTYNDGLASYQEGKKEALSQLDLAYRQLTEGQQLLEKNRADLEDGERQLNEGQAELDENLALLTQGRQELATAKADAYAQIASASAQLLENYKIVNENIKLVNDGLIQIESGLAQLDSGISQLESGLSQLDMTIGLVEGMAALLDPPLALAQKALDDAKAMGASEIVLEPLQKQLDSLLQRKNEYDSQLNDLKQNRDMYSQQLIDLKKQREEIIAQRTELEASKEPLNEALKSIEDGFAQLQNSQAQAEKKFAAAEAELESGLIELEKAQREINTKKAELAAAKITLSEAEETLKQNWSDFRQGRQEALQELSDAELELCNAQAELADAKMTIDSMENPTVYVLTRNTNTGYISLDSASDIVEGISTIFPAFFLLIAALVCITTMTRMVEEERTQIGTMKALGYSNWAIISKYLLYAGSAAVLGCGMGVLIGSMVFPMILWEAYQIMLLLKPEIVLVFDWGLCFAVVAAYTSVTLLVTWYCCKRTLQEVPAELIRPKPPTTGKKIFLEYFPFWNKISFLNKVMLRNIFRYRQRLLMMMIGIGGCTALLLTGFGVRDSLVDIVSYQFEEITLYDLEVRFSHSMDATEQYEFSEEIGRYIEKVHFYHQSSIELETDDTVKDITMIVSDRSIEEFMDFHKGSQTIAMPGQGSAIISVGVAQNMGIAEGDTVILRDADRRELHVTISGIYDNYVQNFVIITPETVHSQWGQALDIQMACVCVGQNQDVYETGRHIAGAENVVNVSVNRDLANSVGSMLEALDLVVVTVVVCAGLLAMIVLYNLTNINITERIREIATIKVLGFNSSESAAYVFKENLMLSAMGAFVGIFGGRLLLNFVISHIKVDMVWFQPRLTTVSYIIGVFLTMIFACLVDFILYFKLEKINMAEALKSVE